MGATSHVSNHKWDGQETRNVIRGNGRDTYGNAMGTGLRIHTVVHAALAPSFYLAQPDQIQWQASFLRRRPGVSVIFVSSHSLSNFAIQSTCKHAPIIVSLMRHLETIICNLRTARMCTETGSWTRLPGAHS